MYLAGSPSSDRLKWPSSSSNNNTPSPQVFPSQSQLLLHHKNQSDHALQENSPLIKPAPRKECDTIKIQNNQETATRPRTLSGASDVSEDFSVKVNVKVSESEATNSQSSSDSLRDELIAKSSPQTSPQNNLSRKSNPDHERGKNTRRVSEYNITKPQKPKTTRRFSEPQFEQKRITSSPDSHSSQEGGSYMTRGYSRGRGRGGKHRQQPHTEHKYTQDRQPTHDYQRSRSNSSDENMSVHYRKHRHQGQQYQGQRSGHRGHRGHQGHYGGFRHQAHHHQHPNHQHQYSDQHWSQRQREYDQHTQARYDNTHREYENTHRQYDNTHRQYENTHRQYENTQDTWYEYSDDFRHGNGRYSHSASAYHRPSHGEKYGNNTGLSDDKGTSPEAGSRTGRSVKLEGWSKSVQTEERDNRDKASGGDKISPRELSGRSQNSVNVHGGNQKWRWKKP